MDKYIVYKHTSPSGKVYIGITKQSARRRWKYGHGYKHNKYFHNAIMKYGWNNIKHEILISNLSIDEASKLEKELISLYTKQKLSYNIAEGGLDGNTHKLTDAEKHHLSVKMKEYFKTHPHPILGKKLSEEAINKMKIGRKKLWQENYDKMYNAVVRKTQVGIFNVLTKEYKEFSSEKEAAEFYNIESTTFRNHVNTGSLFNNYVFFPIEKFSLEEALMRTYNREKMNIHSGGQEIKVVQFTLDGEYLATYPSAKHAALATGLNACGIGKACRGESKHSYGYFWMFESNYSKYKEEGILDTVLNSMKQALCKPRELCITPIIQTTLDGIPIQVYKGGQDIYRKLGFDGSCISKCCRGKLSKAYGYKWKFITKEEYEQYKEQLAA